MDNSVFENANEFVKNMRQVLKTLSGTIQENNNENGCKYLISHFNGNKDLFCQFVGFVRMEMRTPEYKKKHIVIDIWSEIAMAGIMLGRVCGFDDAKRIYCAE